MGRVLIMGGASLLGARLAERLLGQEHEVLAVDDLSRGSFATISELRRYPRFAFVEHDVTARFQARVDAIFHLAVPSSREACEADPVHTTVTSVMGTLHALEVAAAHGVRVVLATSHERWGPGVRCAESLAVEFARRRSLDIRIVRVAHTYGPKMRLDDPSLVLRSALQALRGDGVDVTGPEERVALAYVDDPVETLLRTMSSKLPVAAVSAPFIEATSGEIARAVLDAVGEEVEPAPVGGAVATVPRASATTPDAMPAAILFGQAPALGLSEGVARTVAWLRQRLGLDERIVRESGVFGPTPFGQKAG